MKQRTQFIDQYLRREHSVAELCRRFGISRKTGYKWIARFKEEGGSEGLKVTLADRSRRPHSSPRATERWLEEAIVDARKQRPHWGPKKLRAVLARHNPTVELPAESTFAAVFRRNGLVRPRRRRQRTPPYSAPFAQATRPNALWCVDFKGQFSVGRATCYPLTVTDACSRYLIACIGLSGTEGSSVRRAFERIFDEFGLPDAIRSDSGPPFATRGPAALSSLSAWWHKLGIRHERIKPGRPDQNGRHERMHLTLKQETASPPADRMSSQQRVFDLFRQQFNHERPHEALGQRVPAEFYEPSRRRLPFPPSGGDLKYPDNMETARVNKHGRVAFAGGEFPVSPSLKHELLGIRRYTRDANRWRVFFGAILLGTVARLPGRRRSTLRLVPVDRVSPRPATLTTKGTLKPDSEGRRAPR